MIRRMALMGMMIAGAGLAVPGALGQGADNQGTAESQGIEATYTAGTLPDVPPSSGGILNTTSPTVLEFHAGAAGFSIPYAGITLARYHEENRFRLGVLPAIGVGLLKARSKRHLMTITWKDEHGVVQAAIFEDTRQRCMALLTIVRARAPQVCVTKGDCIGVLPN